MDESGGSAQPRPGNNGAPHDTPREESPSPAEPPTEPAAPTTATPGPDDEHTPSTQGPTAPTTAPGTPGDEHPAPTGPPTPPPPGGEATTPAPTQPPATDDSNTPQSPANGAPDTPADNHPAPRPAPSHSDGPTTPQPHTDHRQSPPADSHPTPQNPHGHTTARTTAHTGAPGQGRPPQRPKDPGGGILMGRPFGVPVYVAPSWFLVAALITWVFGGQLDRVLPELGAARYLVSLFFAVAFYASVLVHELAHTVAALRFKLPVRRIQLQFFGGASEIEKEAETPGREFVLAFVGPLLSLALAGIFYLALQPVEPGTVPGVLLAGLMVSNLIVAAFNLLPGLPLDGGRMLRAIVWKITGRPMSGTIAAAWVGRALAIAVLIGLPLLTQSGALGSTAEDNVGMDTVTDALLAAILAAIIWTGAGNSLRMARLREHLPELRARTLTRRAVPVETDTPLSEALRRANAVGARALVVVDAHGRPLSLVREAAIVGVPEHRRPWVPVSGLAQELNDGMRVSAELAGEDLLDALRATPATEYLVVEDTGEIYGVLSAADVERAFVKAMARPTP
ncbi:site-2 protease family protein [Streptomyces cynarae]|uniref:Site-2 protease family protein n=1 Tax=Streptomyces cynarae TaxID=2981134 RepID=A0ABY6DYR0_9ACTN|nr:site-2 protease family protein [Streptomyces cynarae]UXY18848.1 site-2 protease family protein [Streptomyces cynarae]